MIALDSDHLTALKYTGSERAVRLAARLDRAAAGGEVVGTTVANVEEQMRGWLSAIAKERQPRRQVAPYRDLARLLDFLRGFAVALFNDAAADLFTSYSAVRVKASDKKVAAIAVAHNALLLTANKRDFEQFPGLRFENWLDG
ncbi:MAG: type II toxin-antitoxin system VapC family toxin [Gemmataceae bacterium]|nr:type II toxin-antitoxin system VapC family toxin [Gemmataceae bacterium]